MGLFKAGERVSRGNEKSFVIVSEDQTHKKVFKGILYYRARANQWMRIDGSPKLYYKEGFIPVRMTVEGELLPNLQQQSRLNEVNACRLAVGLPPLTEKDADQCLVAPRRNTTPTK